MQPSKERKEAMLLELSDEDLKREIRKREAFVLKKEHENREKIRRIVNDNINVFEQLAEAQGNQALLKSLKQADFAYDINISFCFEMWRFSDNDKFINKKTGKYVWCEFEDKY